MNFLLEWSPTIRRRPSATYENQVKQNGLLFKERLVNSNCSLLRVRGISEHKIAVCDKTAGLRSGSFSDMNSSCLKVLVLAKKIQI